MAELPKTVLHEINAPAPSLLTTGVKKIPQRVVKHLLREKFPFKVVLILLSVQDIASK